MAMNTRERADGSDVAALSGDTAADRAVAAFVTQLVAMAMGVGAREIAADSRQRAPAALARQVAMYLAHTGCGWTTSRVAIAFRRDRSTVSYACQKVEDLRDDPRLDLMLDACEATLRAAPPPGDPW